MPSPLLDPLLPLAATIHSTPGSHALLLGAGVSVAAGVPSAWAVEQELIRRTAALRGVDDVGGDPHAWYREVFGTEATYESLLERLAPTQQERQRLLREFFEPRPDADGAAQRPAPTAAHRAVARLVADGSVRVVITLNFDRLVEQALREVGVEPVVVASAADVAGLAPVHTLRALVVHLHGDYLTATTMRNTTVELAAYEPDVVSFVEQLLRDHALVLVGWSATYDPALRELLARGMRRLFTSYWVEPGDLSPVAKHLRAQQAIVAVKADADTALGTLTDAVTALRERGARHPLTTPVAVATVKRGLAGSSTAIGVHDLLRSELTTLGEHPALVVPLHLEPAQSLGSLRAQLREASDTPAALLAAVAYWGDEKTDAWWFEELVRFSHQRPLTGGAAPLELLELPRVCGRQLYCAAAVAAVAGRRWALLHRLLTTETTDLEGKPLRLADALGPREGTWADVRDVVAHLTLGPPATERAWEVLELLLLVDRTTRSPGVMKIARDLVKANDELESCRSARRAADANNDADAHDAADAILAEATLHHRRALLTASQALVVRQPHLRVVDAYGSDFFGYPPVVGRELLADVERGQLGVSLAEAGFASRRPHHVRAALMLVCAAVGAVGQGAAHRAMRGVSGVVPGYLWLDDGKAPT